MTNRDRAGYARDALATFTVGTYGERVPESLHPDDVFTAVYDLIGDLGHYLRLYREEHRDEVSDFDTFGLPEAVENGLYHYRCEEGLDWDEEE